MGFLVLLFFFMVFALVVPFLVLKAILHVAVGLAILPFKLLGLFGKLVAVFLKVAVAGALLLVTAIGILLGIVLLPLLPLFVLIGVVWFAVRAASPRPAGRLA